MLSKWLAAFSLSTFGLFTIFSKTLAATVSSPDFAALSAAIASNTNVQLAFDGVIQFPTPIQINKRVIIDASGHSVAFDGRNANQLFIVTNGDLTLSSVTLRNASTPNTELGSSGWGGAIYVSNGTLILSNCIATDNQARGGDGRITTYSTGPPENTFEATVIKGGSAFGGCVYATNSQVVLAHCSFHNNASLGGRGFFQPYPGAVNVGWVADPGNGFGGVVHAGNSEITVTNCTFNSNTAQAGAAGLYRGVANGGALSVQLSEHVVIGNSSFISNSTMVGDDYGGYGGAASSDSGVTFVRNALFFANHSGNGGALNLASTGEVTRCLFSSNSTTVWRGPSQGGAVRHTRPLVIDQSAFHNNSARGGDGWDSGNHTFPASPGHGGAVSTEALLNAINCIFVGNSVASGFGGQAEPGQGGAIATGSRSELRLTHCSFSSNAIFIDPRFSTSEPPPGSAIWLDTNNSTLTLQASVISNPQSFPAINVTNIIDAGFNISSDSTPYFDKPTSLNNTDPFLEFVPTANLAILRPKIGSPAIDRVSTHLTDYDIRGALRPQTGSDSGAVELQAAIPLSLSTANGFFTLSIQSYSEPLRLFATCDFKTWTDLGLINPTNQALTFPATPPTHQFFRLQLDPSP